MTKTNITIRLCLVIVGLIFSQTILAQENIHISIDNQTDSHIWYAVEFNTGTKGHTYSRLEKNSGIGYTYNLEDSGYILSKPFPLHFYIKDNYYNNDICTVKTILNAAGLKNPLLEISVKNVDRYHPENCKIDINIKEDSE